MERRLVCGLFISVLALCLASPKPIKAITIRSADIAPADGTSGQVLATGSGVKTGHIQDLAVTGAKIAAGTITSGNIDNGQITNALLAPNAVTADKIQDGAVGHLDLANGAVTDDNITGPISGSKISSSDLNADTVDGKHAADLAAALHTHSQSDVTGLTNALAGKADFNHDHDDVYQKKDAHVLVVSLDGNGDFASPGDAINSITDSAENNRYLVRVMPGVYEVSGLNVPDYVDLIGSGIDAT